MRWITRHLRSTLLMLLMAAFVVVPVADVLACAVEPHDTTAVHVESNANDAGVTVTASTPVPAATTTATTPT